MLVSMGRHSCAHSGTYVAAAARGRGDVVRRNLGIHVPPNRRGDPGPDESLRTVSLKTLAEEFVKSL